MTSSRTLIWFSFAAGLALLAAVAVYCFARAHPPEILAPFAAVYSPHLAHLSFSGYAPSYFYTLTLALLIVMVAGSSTAAIRHCLLWTVLPVVLEFSQLAIVSYRWSNWRRDWYQTWSGKCLHLTGPREFLTPGTFWRRLLAVAPG